MGHSIATRRGEQQASPNGWGPLGPRGVEKLRSCCEGWRSFAHVVPRGLEKRRSHVVRGGTCSIGDMPLASIIAPAYQNGHEARTKSNLVGMGQSCSPQDLRE